MHDIDSAAFVTIVNLIISSSTPQDDLIAETAAPPSYLKADLHHLPLASLRCEFDVILVEPPLEEYQHTAPGHAAALNGFWDWNQIRELDIAQVGR